MGKKKKVSLSRKDRIPVSWPFVVSLYFYILSIISNSATSNCHFATQLFTFVSIQVVGDQCEQIYDIIEISSVYLYTINNSKFFF